MEHDELVRINYILVLVTNKLLMNLSTKPLRITLLKWPIFDLFHLLVKFSDYI